MEMSTEPIRMERRARQRFEVNLPVSIQLDGLTVAGFTQDVSARGIFLYSEKPISEGTRLELTLTLPAEVTLAESMRVRCCGRVLRSSLSAGERHGIAVYLESYEYLPESESSSELARFEREPSPEEPNVSPR
jgi:hypothetical protein